MSLWRLEWLRLRRTWRGVGLPVLFLFFGLIGPFIARYLEDIVTFADPNAQVMFPPPEPADGVIQYISNSQQIGLLAVIIVSAGAFALDARADFGAFLRTRVSSMARLVLTRYAVYAAFAAAVFALGLLAAWYETHVLLGPLPAGAVVAGMLFTAVYYAWLVAVVALAAGIARGLMGTVFLAFGVVVSLAIVSIVPRVAEWLPLHLAGSSAGLVSGDEAADYLPAAVVAVAMSAVALWAAIRLLDRREL